MSTICRFQNKKPIYSSKVWASIISPVMQITENSRVKNASSKTYHISVKAFCKTCLVNHMWFAAIDQYIYIYIYIFITRCDSVVSLSVLNSLTDYPTATMDERSEIIAIYISFLNDL